VDTHTTQGSFSFHVGEIGEAMFDPLVVSRAVHFASSPCRGGVAIFSALSLNRFAHDFGRETAKGS
jgi:hypothetical protein